MIIQPFFKREKEYKSSTLWQTHLEPWKYLIVTIRKWPDYFLSFVCSC